MIRELAILILPVAIGVPLVAVIGRSLLSEIGRMRQISRISAWVGGVAVGAGIAVSAFIGLAVILAGNPIYGPLSALGSALFVEVVVFSQLRNGTRAWERRERMMNFGAARSATVEIQRRLDERNLPTVKRAALRLQLLILRSLGLGSSHDHTA